jgi:hypothetical protein
MVFIYIGKTIFRMLTVSKSKSCHTGHFFLITVGFYARSRVDPRLLSQCRQHDFPMRLWVSAGGMKKLTPVTQSATSTVPNTKTRTPAVHL